jgi:hypothetical protein
MVDYQGEAPYGDDSVSHLTGMVKRDWNIIIERTKTDTEPRNLDLTSTIGSAVPFYTLAEQLRDVVRAILWPQPECYNPTLFNDMRGEKMEGEYSIRKFVISISVLVQIPRIVFQAPIGYGPLSGSYVNY